MTTWTTSIVHRARLCDFDIEIELVGNPARWSVQIRDSVGKIVFASGEPIDANAPDLGVGALKHAAICEVTRLDTADI